MSSIDISGLVRQLPSQYPFVMVDRILEHDPERGLVALKNVTGSEDFFEGHFPGEPVMPGVLLMECLAQAAGIWLLKGSQDPGSTEVHVVGIDDAKFRRPAVPGDQLRLDVALLHRRGALCRFEGEVSCEGRRVAEARLLLQVVTAERPRIDPTARVAPGAVLEPGVRVGPYSVVGPRVRIGAGTVLESHVVVDGNTQLGRKNHVFPFASIGKPPQDLKFKGENTRLEIGDRNVLREGVTMSPGTGAGGALTRLGSDNLIMVYAHIAHDCFVGSHTIFGNGATLAGHVEVGDHANIGAYSAVHQFCRVGVHAFIGGYSVATKDVLPYSKTVGNRACIYGVNGLGLERRGFEPERVKAIRQAYRILLQSRLNTTEALARIDSEGPRTPEVRGLVEFIRSSKRGVILKRRNPHRASGA